MLNSATSSTPTVRNGVPWSTDLVIVAAAVICVMVMWLCTARLGGVNLVVANDDDEVRHISGWAVALSAGTAATLGLMALRGLERLMPQALRAWTVVAVVAAALSALGPLSATTWEVAGTLLGMHGVVAAVVLVGAWRSRRPAVRRAPTGHTDSEASGIR